jgi:hypothetical protein
MSSTDKSIKFPKKHYVGFQARPSVDDVPLGFMTPDGEDAAAKKRKTSVDNWAAGNYYGNSNKEAKLPAQTFDNDPMIGFKLGRSIRHGGSGWGQGNVKWRIEDPRGFELEISSPNFAQIISFCNVERGEIQEQCVWARLGSENILVPVNSDVYENAVQNTERMAKKASLRDIKIGDDVVMQNGDAGKYMGVYYVTNRQRPSYNRVGVVSHTLNFGTKKRHVFIVQTMKDGSFESSKSMRAISTPKVAEVYEGPRTMTPEEAEIEVNRLMREEKYYLSESTNDYLGSPIALTREPMDDSSFVLTSRKLSLTAGIAKMSASKLNYNLAESYTGGATVTTVINDKTYLINLDSVFTARQYLPGGKNHAHLRTQQNAGFYGRGYRPQNEVALQEVISDIEADRVIETKDYNARSFYNEAGDYFDVTVLPDELTVYQLDGQSAAGIKISCQL